MRALLGLSILVLGFIFITTINPGLGPGLSMKNVFVYLPVGITVINSFLIGRPIKLENRALHAWFAILFCYSLATIVVGALVLRYPEYGLLDNILDLKGSMFDWWVIFLAFSQFPRTAEDVESLIKTLLVVVSLANTLAIGQLLGAVNLHRDVMCDVGDARFCGVFGHANETAALVASLVPAYIAVAESSVGMRRLFWIGCLASSAMTLILTASRGAFVGLICGSAWAAMLCQRYLSVQRFVKWLSVGAATMVPLMVIIGVKYWHMMIGRWTDVSTVSAADMTSGRTEIWQAYLMKMVDSPWTFITGFGWNSYSVANFPVIPHNQYLSFWFSIGLIGVVGFIFMMRQVVTTALAAAYLAPPHSNARRHIVAGIFGTIILAVAVFFGTMIATWQIQWMYMGLVLRYCTLVHNERRQLPQQQETAEHRRALRVGTPRTGTASPA